MNWSVAAALVLVACGPGGVAREVRPDAPKGSSAGVGSDLLIDLPSTERAEIELALREGSFAVRRDGARIVALPTCRPRSTEIVWGPSHGNGRVGDRPLLRWKVESFPAKHEIVKLRDASTLRAALPRTAAALGAQVEAELERGASLDLALVSRGLGRLEETKSYLSQITSHWPPHDDDPCRQATHVVTSVTFGAFALATVAGARQSTAASIFGAGASTTSNSAREAAVHEGDLVDCEAGNKAGRCAVPIRWTLTPIDPRYEGRAACEDRDDAEACGHWLQAVARETSAPDRPAAIARGRAVCRTGSLTQTSAAAYACEGLLESRSRPDASAPIPEEELDRAARVACLGFLPYGCMRYVKRAKERGDYDEAFRTLSVQCHVRREDAVACWQMLHQHEERPRPTSDAGPLTHAWGRLCLDSGDCGKRPSSTWFDARALTELHDQSERIVGSCTEATSQTSACKSAAAAYAYGIGIPRDLVAAKRAWQTSCRAALAAGGTCPPMPYGR